MSAPDSIEQVANAVLYEGFLLYPYRLSSVKNRHRWNFGVLFPEPFASAHGERSRCATECLLLAEAGASVDIRIRFLQLAEDAASEREVAIENLNLEPLVSGDHKTSISFPPLTGLVEVGAEKIQDGLHRLRVSVINSAEYHGTGRDQALTAALLSIHCLLRANRGKFISQADPPDLFRSAAESCRNDGWWPVLAGQGDSQMLAAPIILHDHPQIAPQSHGNLFDTTEIDEILTLRVRTLTDAEKIEARNGDQRARELVDRCDELTRHDLLQLHAPMRPSARTKFSKGDRVRLKPRRRADIFDLALAGKMATVVSVEQDFEDRVHLCVTVDDDPGRDLGVDGKPGHRFFFGADEVERA